MPCYSPLKAFRSESERTTNGKRAIVFKEEGSLTSLDLPCGQCIGCRLNRSRMWAIRCVNEASLHDSNLFLTLTFNDEQSLERRTTLIKRDFQLFVKRLRKRFPKRKYGKISYYYCGEYGEALQRPHYHACFFNLSLPDKTFLKESNGEKIYTSDLLDQIWGFGHCFVGNVTLQSASYVAGYITKKITGPMSDEYYAGRTPEFSGMSTRPAIGRDWLEKYFSDVYPCDEVVVNGRSMLPPKYYDKYLVEKFPELCDEVFMKREESLHVLLNHPDSSPRRLLDRYEVQQLKFNRFSRDLGSKLAPSTNFDSYDYKSLNYQKGVL